MLLNDLLAGTSCGSLLKGRRVLVVEDGYLLAEDLREQLLDYGVEVVGPVATVPVRLEDPMTFHSASPLPTSHQPLIPTFDQDVLALRPALHAFASRLTRQKADAEDLVQDTILKALAARQHFQPGTSLKAWLFTIMRNSFNTRWRRSCREVVTEPEVIGRDAVTCASQETNLWVQEAIEHLLHSLSPAHREILLLVPVQGLSYEDAAQFCGCSVGTVKSRLNRARAALAALTSADGSEKLTRH